MWTGQGSWDFVGLGRLGACTTALKDEIDKGMHYPSMAPRALSGVPCCRSFNAVHGSDAPDTAAAEIDFFFSNPLLGKCDLARNTSLGIIKPHVVTDGLAGLALDIVQENFEVTALRLCTLDKPSATEFYEVCAAG